MKKMNIDIQLDPVKDGTNWGIDNTKNKREGALIVGTNGKYRFVEEEEAREILERLYECSAFDYLGKSSFLLIYNRKKVLYANDTKFLVGSGMIVRATKKGLEFIDKSEILEAKMEFESRIVTLCGNDILFSAYEIG